MNIDRKCPEYSVVSDDRCYDAVSLLNSSDRFLETSFDCPNSSQKWPQCDISIQKNLLLSLVG